MIITCISIRETTVCDSTQNKFPCQLVVIVKSFCYMSKEDDKLKAESIRRNNRW